MNRMISLNPPVLSSRHSDQKRNVKRPALDEARLMAEVGDWMEAEVDDALGLFGLGGTGQGSVRELTTSL